MLITAIECLSAIALLTPAANIRGSMTVPEAAAVVACLALAGWLFTLASGVLG